MFVKINNPTKKYIYFNKSTGNVHQNIFELLNIDLIRKANLKSHENNISNYFSRPDKYQEVVEGIYPIPPRSTWKYEEDKFYNLNNRIVSSNISSDFPELLNIIDRLSKPLLDKNIGIELSGGLDTSIIIGLIKHLGLNPFLVGINSSRYELRTESYIQEKYQKNHSNVCLIDSRDSLPFSNLLYCPIHQLPSSSSLYHIHAFQIAKESNKKGINIILSGMGFDTLLCENPIQECIDPLIFGQNGVNI